MALKHRLRQAEKQRYTALKNAFKTVDEFIEPSYTPEIGRKHNDVKKYLLKLYKPK